MTERVQMNLDLAGVNAARESKIDLLPAGEFSAECIDVEAKENSGKTGFFLMIFWKVLFGPQAGKVFSDVLSVIHQNPDTERIAKENLKFILEKNNYPNPNLLAFNTDVVGMNINVLLVESSYKGTDGNEISSNEVKKYRTFADAPESSQAKLPATPLAPVAPVVPVAPVAPAAPVAPLAPAAPAAPAAPVAPPAAPAPSGAYPWGTLR